jgi:hypothetical protein
MGVSLFKQVSKSAAPFIYLVDWCMRAADVHFHLKCAAGLLGMASFVCSVLVQYRFVTCFALCSGSCPMRASVVFIQQKTQRDLYSIDAVILKTRRPIAAAAA